MRLDQPELIKPASETNNKGFTLLEVVICLAILIVVSSLLPILFLHLHQLNETMEENIYEEWDLFVIQFRNEVKLHQIQHIEPKRLTLVNQTGHSIVFSLYGNLLRRQVNGAGHEVYLTGINELNFTSVNQLLYLEVVFTNGTIKKAQFIDRVSLGKGEHYAAISNHVFYDHIHADYFSINLLSSNLPFRNTRHILRKTFSG